MIHTRKCSSLIKHARYGPVIFVFATKDGQMLEHSVTSAPILESEGEIRDVVLVMRDLSKLRIMEQRLNQSQKT